MFPRHYTDRIALRGYKETGFHGTLPNALPSADRRYHVSRPVHRAHCPPRMQRTMFPRHSTERIALRCYKEPRFHATQTNALPSSDTSNHVCTALHRTLCPPRIQGTTFPRHSTDLIALRGYKETRFHATPPIALPFADARNHVSMPLRAHCPPWIHVHTFPSQSTERIALRVYKEPRLHTTTLSSLPFADTRKHVSTPLHRAHCPPRIQGPRFHAIPPIALSSADTKKHVSTPIHLAHCPPRLEGSTFPRHSIKHIALRGCKESLPRPCTESIALRVYKERRFHATPPCALPSADRRNLVSTPLLRAHFPPQIQGSTYLRHSSERNVLRGYKEPRFHAIPPNALPSTGTRKHVSTPLH